MIVKICEIAQLTRAMPGSSLVYNRSTSFENMNAILLGIAKVATPSRALTFKLRLDHWLHPLLLIIFRQIVRCILTNELLEIVAMKLRLHISMQ